jgi:DNA-binding FrmR family transcriptional regulator
MQRARHSALPASHTSAGALVRYRAGYSRRVIRDRQEALSMELDPDEMQTVVKRLRRAQGQLGGVLKMIDDGRECQEIVTQLAAVSKALDRAGFAVIALGLRQCIADPEGHEMDVETMEKLFLSLA